VLRVLRPLGRVVAEWFVRSWKCQSARSEESCSGALAAFENGSSLERFVQVRKTLLFLCVGNEWEAKDERDEVEPGRSAHCGLGWKSGTFSGDACSSGASLYQRIDAFFLALPAGDNAAKSADDADESPAICARVAFGGTLLVLA
jgi:hypothetical protein